MRAGLLPLCCCVLFAASAGAQETPETAQLRARTPEFERDIVKVTDGVYSAVGYGASVFSMIVGDDGIVVVDAGQLPQWSAEAFAEFRKISDKPLRAIILTHGHGDHTNGLAAFEDEPDVQIWAREGFGSEGRALTDVGLKIQRRRGLRQAGFMVPPEKRINNGVAGLIVMPPGVRPFAAQVKPSHSFDEDRVKLTIAGVELELVAAPGETADQLYVWLPERKVVFAGDNFYKAWPNLSAIRGTPYRHPDDWANSIDAMLNEGPHFLVGGHTRPVLGEAKVTEVMTNYRDAIRYVFDKTVEGMNQGLTPDELVDYVQLPPELAELDYLQPYYGHPDWGVRGIFSGTLGWFDGNPTNLFPLPPKERAQRTAALAGGPDALRQQARQALDAGDYQWAAELADHLIALDPDAPGPKLLKADALDALALSTLTSTGRHYYQTVSVELRRQAGGGAAPAR